MALLRNVASLGSEVFLGRYFFSNIFFSKLEMGLDMCEAERNLILFLSGSRKQFLNNQRQKHCNAGSNYLDVDRGHQRGSY